MGRGGLWVFRGSGPGSRWDGHLQSANTNTRVFERLWWTWGWTRDILSIFNALKKVFLLTVMIRCVSESHSPVKTLCFFITLCFSPLIDSRASAVNMNDDVLFGASCSAVVAGGLRLYRWERMIGFDVFINDRIPNSHMLTHYKCDLISDASALSWSVAGRSLILLTEALYFNHLCLHSVCAL